MADANDVGNVAEPVFIEGRSMVILYGSETGNGEEIATELGKMAERLHFQTVVDEMDSFKLTDLLRASMAVFVTSTTGQGDMPKNTLKFWKSLRRERLNHTNCLGAVKFTIFGLGDSSYPKFNWAARKLRARLLQLGASEAFKAGEADERHDNGIDSIYLPWQQEFRAALLANYPLPEDIQPIPDDVQLPPKYLLRLAPTMTARDQPSNDQEASSLTEEERRFFATKSLSAALTHVDRPRSKAEQVHDVDPPRRKADFPAHIARSDGNWEQKNGRQADLLDRDNVIKDHPEKYLLQKAHHTAKSLPPPDLIPIPNSSVALVIRNERVTPEDHWQDVRHISLLADVRPGFPRCLAGATITIYPKNYPEDVQTLIDLMGWNGTADKPLAWGYASEPSALRAHVGYPRPRRLHVDQDRDTTLRDLLTHNLDITAIPKRNFIRELAFFTDDVREQERLRELAAYGNEQEFYDYTSRPRRTIIELLQDFPRVRIPWNRALDLFPIIRGRLFSVCNGAESVPPRATAVEVEILVALVEYKTIIRKPRQGLASRYLKHLPENTHIRVSFNSSDSLPETDKVTAQRPLIAVATGTGIAPIRALIQDRSAFADQGPTLLFFGCRNRRADFYFHDEWDMRGNIEVHAAFSRDPVKPSEARDLDPYGEDELWPSRQDRQKTPPKVEKPSFATTGLHVYDYDKGKNYVQHHIRKHAQRVGELMRQDPIIAVCGTGGRMSVSVRNALFDAMILSGVVKTREEAQKFLSDPQRCLYWQETW
ncbi:hypothetical protein QBC46DRAFT_251137 [Diplogelasinospora grovesii]|uniref:Uncharacterized protein n=1 Tax=Diplogelasinospora grovesii TaxID=303347 RepID=A0AAN6S8V4_9PEZI|nr:hypothetical protein QBC46DRAFT_251137 [Diplogelasinospora grovesii]